MQSKVYLTSYPVYVAILVYMDARREEIYSFQRKYPCQRQIEFTTSSLTALSGMGKLYYGDPSLNVRKVGR